MLSKRSPGGQPANKNHLRRLKGFSEFDLSTKQGLEDCLREATRQRLRNEISDRGLSAITSAITTLLKQRTDTVNRKPVSNPWSNARLPYERISSELSETEKQLLTHCLDAAIEAWTPLNDPAFLVTRTPDERAVIIKTLSRYSELTGKTEPDNMMGFVIWLGQLNPSMMTTERFEQIIEAGGRRYAAERANDPHGDENWEALMRLNESKDGKQSEVNQDE